MQRVITKLWGDESGQDLPEYAVLIGLVALTVIAAVVLLGGSISTTFNGIGTGMVNADVSGT